MREYSFRTALIAMLLSIFIQPALAVESSYSKIDFDRDCKFDPPTSNEGGGVSGECRFGNNPVMYYLEGDLRQSVGFGAPGKYQSFGQFNYMNNVIEWRSNNGKPFAAIVRFFINIAVDDILAKKKPREGQVLVVHRVAQSPDDLTCIVGMVDARANRNANVIAREIADELAEDFRCGQTRPKYYGKKGAFAGDLM